MDYVEEIYPTFVNASKDELNETSTKLKDFTPALLNTMLDRQSKEQVPLQKRAERSKIVTRDVPPTRPGNLSSFE